MLTSLRVSDHRRYQNPLVESSDTWAMLHPCLSETAFHHATLNIAFQGRGIRGRQVEHRLGISAERPLDGVWFQHLSRPTRYQACEIHHAANTRQLAPLGTLPFTFFEPDLDLDLRASSLIEAEPGGKVASLEMGPPRVSARRVDRRKEEGDRRGWWRWCTSVAWASGKAQRGGATDDRCRPLG